MTLVWCVTCSSRASRGSRVESGMQAEEGMRWCLKAECVCEWCGGERMQTCWSVLWDWEGGGLWGLHLSRAHAPPSRQCVRVTLGGGARWLQKESLGAQEDHTPPSSIHLHCHYLSSPHLCRTQSFPPESWVCAHVMSAREWRTGSVG